MTTPTTEDAAVVLYPTAAKHILKLLQAEPEYSEKSGIRIQMMPGGCSGMKYDLQFAAEVGVGEMVLEQHGVKMFIPGAWLHFLRGTTIDYTESLSGSGFKIENPNIKRSCGCGKSVS